MDEGDEFMLGITLGVLGSVCINTGNNIQSLGMAQLEVKYHQLAAAADEEERRAHKSSSDDGEGFDEEDPNSNRKQPQQPQQQGEDEEDREIDTCDSPVWVAGTEIFVTGSLLNFAAFAFAPQSILAALEGIQFVTNVLFGRCILGSTITNTMYLGVRSTEINLEERNSSVYHGWPYLRPSMDCAAFFLD